MLKVAEKVVQVTVINLFKEQQEVMFKELKKNINKKRRSLDSDWVHFPALLLTNHIILNSLLNF